MLSTAFTGIPQLLIPKPNVISDAIEEDKFDFDGVALTPLGNPAPMRIE